MNISRTFSQNLRAGILAHNFPVLAEGINVMDLGEMSDGVQMLTIESCLAHILKMRSGSLLSFRRLGNFRQGKPSPVKEHFIVLSPARRCRKELHLV